MKRIACLILTICLVIGLFCFNVFASDTESQKLIKEEQKVIEKYGKDFFENQEKANESYEEIKKSFNKDRASEYPEYYGGAYVNDAGNLVIYVIDYDKKNEEEKDKYREMYYTITKDKNITIKNAKYSYSSLTKTMDKLNQYCENNPLDEISKNLDTYALLDAENKIVVELENCNEEVIKKFKSKVIDTSQIEFKKAEAESEDYASLKPGRKILKSNGGMASMGYRAKKNGVSGIVTAGHFADLNTKIYVGSKKIGTVTAYAESGSVDAAFVKVTNSSYVPSNTLYGTSNSLSTTISEPGVGTVINKIGAKTGHTSGKIVSTNSTFKVNGNRFTNLTKADFDAAKGDSGCIVYSYIASTNTRLTLGILKGGRGNYCYYVKANQINSRLGISRY